MERFIINGGRPLKGEIDVRGAKNAAFPLLAGTILTKQDCTVSNLPLIEDVYRMIEILEGMGAHVKWKGERSVTINTRALNPTKIQKDLVLKFRGSVLLFGPLLARFGKVKLPLPGGDIIGPRPIDTHIDAFSQLGVQAKVKKKEIELRQPKTLKNTEVILNEFSVTATENILLFAALQSKQITVKTADQDYPIQELITFLKRLGVGIETSGLHVLTIKGKKLLKGAKHTLLYDPIEAGTFIVLAAAARGDVLVKNVELQYLELLLKKLRDFGVPLEIKKRNVHVRPWKTLRIDKIQSFIYPGIHSDLQSVLGVLATQATGSTLLHDPLYEGRLKYLEELNKMGAEIYFTDPHRAIINGPTRLYGTDLGAFDIRGGAAVIIGALIAKGKSAISNVYQVDRGYEHIEERLQKLGADIKRVNN
jgi:UDP-N-acetylglucosamine 1-carboxyvinyltransferase